MKELKRSLLLLTLAGCMAAGCTYDDGELWNRVNDHEKRLAALEDINTGIGGLWTIVNALQTHDYIESVAANADGSFTIRFGKADPVTIKNGTDAPVISAALFEGDYYWTSGGEWLTDTEGNKLRVSGVTPLVGIDGEGFWTVDTGDGARRITDAQGQPVKAEGTDGESLFSAIDHSHDEHVVFTLADGTSQIRVPKHMPVTVIFSGVTDYIFDTPIEPGQTYRIAYELTGDRAESITVIKAESDAPDIRVEVTKTTPTTGTVVITTDAVIPASTMVTMLISDGKGYLTMYALTLNAAPLLMPESNSYMAEPDGIPILIPVSRANAVLDPTRNLGAVTTGLGGVTADNFTVDLVWSDTPVGDGGVIREMSAKEIGGEGYILVRPGKGGNAVICVKVGEVIKWSWHIWVTERVGTGTDTKTGLTWMDRNLGAMAATPLVGGVFDRGQWIKTTGLYYQWGRKDAFPTSNWVPTYDGASHYGNQLYFTPGDPAGTRADFTLADYDELPDLVKNPLHFANGFSNYYGSVKEADDNNSWGGSTNQKTIYDPCPPGWRVPVRTYDGTNKSWGNSNTDATFALATEHVGWIFNGVEGTANLGQFYPAAGERTVNASSKVIGNTGHYWTGSANWGGFADPCQAFYLYISSLNYANRYPDNSAYSTEGKSVRCVRE